jgi:hypothetical protein
MSKETKKSGKAQSGADRERNKRDMIHDGKENKTDT